MPTPTPTGRTAAGGASRRRTPPAAPRRPRSRRSPRRSGARARAPRPRRPGAAAGNGAGASWRVEIGEPRGHVALAAAEAQDLDVVALGRAARIAGRGRAPGRSSAGRSACAWRRAAPRTLSYVYGWAPAPALEPDRVVLPVVGHERAAGGDEREQRRARVAVDGDQTDAGERRDHRAGGAVMAALAEDPDAAAERVVLNELRRRSWPGESICCLIYEPVIGPLC